MANKIDCLSISVTNRCPLKCDHCGPESGPKSKGEIDWNILMSAFNDAKKHRCSVVNITGGEPFILGPRLEQIIYQISKRGIIARVTSSGYWSKSISVAEKKLIRLQRAGLSQLVLSYSVGHRKFLPIMNLIYAVKVAYKLNLDIYINLGITENSKDSINWILQEFEKAGVSIPVIKKTPIIPFGRAKVNHNDNLVLKEVEEIRGACASIIRSPMIYENGNVSGCGVVFGSQCKPLTFGNLSRRSFNEIYEDMNNNPFAVWIHKIGVVALKELIETNTKIRFNRKYSNICHLCGSILSNKQAIQYLISTNFLR